MEPILSETLIVYGPLGIMVVGLGWAVIYLWRSLQSAHEKMISLLQTQLANEATMQANYTKLCIQLQHSLEVLTERLAHVTTDQRDGRGSS